MKKQYVKPYLALESFQLVAALAAGCNEIVTFINSTYSTCPPEEDMAVFTDGLCQIDYSVVGCYQTATGGTVFAAS